LAPKGIDMAIPLQPELLASSAGTPSASAADPSERSRKLVSRVLGALFLLGFLTYGVGFGLVTSVVGAPDFLARIPARQTTLLLGAFLMLLNSIVDVGKGVLFFPVLERHGKRTALLYLVTMIVEVLLLDIGVLSLLMLVPLSHEGVGAAQAHGGWASALGALAIQSNALAYQIGEMSLGLGCVFLCLRLLRSGLIPRFMAIWGVVGYAILVEGTIAELFGSHIGLALSIPGGLFEVALGVWLLIKGFEPDAYRHCV